MRQYSIDQVEVAWMGLDFKEGLATGTSISEARTVPSWSTKEKGAVPKIVRTYNPSKSGQLTVVVDQESQLHQQLKAIAQADSLTRDQVAVMTINDASSSEVFNFRNAFIMTEPDMGRGTESATFSWVFMYESRDSAPVDELTNLVGN